MDNIEVKIVRSQPLQTAVNLPVDGLPGETAGIEIDLGRDHGFLPADILFQRTAQIFLAGSGRITVCGIEKVDAKVKGVLHHFLGSRFVQRPVVHGSCLAETHTAHADLGNFNIGLS